jgi:hypothetical protein
MLKAEILSIGCCINRITTILMIKFLFRFENHLLATTNNIVQMDAMTTNTIIGRKAVQKILKKAVDGANPFISPSLMKQSKDKNTSAGDPKMLNIENTLPNIFGILMLNDSVMVKI